MKKLLNIPHVIAHGLCPVNGIRDMIHWHTGHNLSNEFLFGLGQGGGFAYLRFNSANPPRQVYWGTSSARQHKYLSELLQADYYELENRSFKHTWKIAQEAIDNETPPIIGPLDMFHLHFYKDIYHQRHIPIHYLLVSGYDEENAYVQDTDLIEVQSIPLGELETAWNVNVPGLGKRNRLVTLNIPATIAPVELLIRKSISDMCDTMLKPPVSMLGIPAMEKLSREIADWPQELGEEPTGRCLVQVREYLNSPPDVMGNHLTAGRDIYVTFLEQAAKKANLDFSTAIESFYSGIQVIPKIAKAIQRGDLENAAQGFSKIAEIEKQAFKLLLEIVGNPDLTKSN